MKTRAATAGEKGPTPTKNAAKATMPDVALFSKDKKSAALPDYLAWPTHCILHRAAGVLVCQLITRPPTLADEGNIYLAQAH